MTMLVLEIFGCNLAGEMSLHFPPCLLLLERARRGGGGEGSNPYVMLCYAILRAQQRPKLNEINCIGLEAAGYYYKP